MFLAESCLAIGGSADTGLNVDFNFHDPRLDNDQMFLDFQYVLLLYLLGFLPGVLAFQHILREILF